MGTRELIARELERVPDGDLDELLAVLRSINEAHLESALPARLAETALAKDWLSPEEDSACGRFVRGDVVVNQSSRIRPSRVFTADESIVIYRAGHVSNAKLDQVIERLTAIFRKA